MQDTPGARAGGPVTRVVVLSGSPAPDSRTWSLAAVVAARLSSLGLDVELFDLRALPPAEVLLGPGPAGPVREALDAVARADGVVAVTPVHHSAYSGLLKAFLDLLPRFALGGKVVLPMAVGGSAAHVLTIDYALRPVLVALSAVHVTRGQVMLHDEIGRNPDGATCIDCEAERRLDGVLREFALCLRLHTAEPRPPSAPRSMPSGAERTVLPPSGIEAVVVGATPAGLQLG